MEKCYLWFAASWINTSDYPTAVGWFCSFQSYWKQSSPLVDRTHLSTYPGKRINVGCTMNQPFFQTKDELLIINVSVHFGKWYSIGCTQPAFLIVSSRNRPWVADVSELWRHPTHNMRFAMQNKPRMSKINKVTYFHPKLWLAEPHVEHPVKASVSSILSGPSGWLVEITLGGYHESKGGCSMTFHEILRATTEDGRNGTTKRKSSLWFDSQIYRPSYASLSTNEEVES